MTSDMNLAGEVIFGHNSAQTSGGKNGRVGLIFSSAVSFTFNRVH